MQGTTQNYTLDMVDERKKEPLRVKQYDTNSRWARISLTAFGEPWSIPVGSRGYISIKKVDGTVVLNDCTIEGENQVLAPISEQATAVQGIQQAELYFLAVDGDIKSQTFPINVYPAIMDQRIIESSNEFGTLQTAIIGAQEATRTAQDAAAEAMVQAGEAREAAEIAMDAAASIDVAVQAAAAAKTSETNAKASETAAAQFKTDVEAMKAEFAGYDKTESGRKYANALTTTVEGEGQVVVTDAWEAPVVNLEVDGASEQVATTGAQLLDFKAKKGSQVQNGITLTINADGRVAVNGTATSDTTFILSSNGHIPLEVGKNYAMRGYGTSFDNNFFWQAWVKDPGGAFKDTGLGATFLYTKESEFNFSVLVKSGKTVNATFWPMLNEGSTALPWEPYTGGKPSPSPEYPQEIVSVAHVANSGAQLLDYLSLPSATMNGVTFTPRTDGTVSAIGLATDVSAFDLFESELPPGTYCISGCPTGATMETYQIIAYRKTGGNFTILGADTGSGAVFNVVQGENIVIRIVLRKGTSGPIVFRPMLNAGSTPQPWESYNGQQREIDFKVESSGAQLYDASKAIPRRDTIAEIEFGGRRISVSGASAYSALERTIPIKLVANKTLTLSGEIVSQTNQAGSAVMQALLTLADNTLQYRTITSAERKITFNVPVDAKGVSVRLISNNTSIALDTPNTVVYADVMLNIGNTPLPWEPYRYQKVTIPLSEPLRSVTVSSGGNYTDRNNQQWICDTIELKDGMAEYVQRVGYYQISNSTALSKSAAETETLNNFHIANSALSTFEHTGSKSGLMCRMLKTGDIGGFNQKNTIFIAGEKSNRIYFCVPKTMASTLEEFKTWAVEAGLDFIYALPEPVKTKLSEEATAALNALTTHPGTTYLTVTSTDISAPIRLTYVQDTRKVIEGLQLDMAEQMVELQAQIDQLKVTNNLA